ncbi:unnamed protein product (macronuclear) [Paramecium tetraurelia]|uniref:Uncharacterized protein n=1 Tax=Paramecium tetraurelia TaxID=5888 RepID=A0C045_PARTE|nr:uncharacterized protein GSPATT00006015001 [Paramecium tetraurelia]CAK64162.1 unnamed protein product [Paramecium tetraurelia]|eukprot:XP_001431560.1 hypothetical protein (macronuclear) [Paramecium tetraurelia strain d4-2]
MAKFLWIHHTVYLSQNKISKIHLKNEGPFSLLKGYLQEPYPSIHLILKGWKRHKRNIVNPLSLNLYLLDIMQLEHILVQAKLLVLVYFYLEYICLWSSICLHSLNQEGMGMALMEMIKVANFHKPDQIINGRRIKVIHLLLCLSVLVLLKCLMLQYLHEIDLPLINYRLVHYQLEEYLQPILDIGHIWILHSIIQYILLVQNIFNIFPLTIEVCYYCLNILGPLQRSFLLQQYWLMTYQKYFHE